MERLNFRLDLVTPAFLGGATQSSEWRLPPIKAALRQWWRIVAAKHNGYDFMKIRELEGSLFGHAWLKHSGPGIEARTWALKSPVRFALRSWTPGKMSSWQNDPKISHPEVGMPVGAHLYLGYGPLTFKDGHTALKAPPALSPRETATLSLYFPETVATPYGNLRVGAHLQLAFRLLRAFGTIGGRSRNGWGSVDCEPYQEHDGAPHNAVAESGASLSLLELDQMLLKCSREFSRSLEDCLKLDWPHAIGVDTTGVLVWRSRKPWSSWEQAMEFIATLKIALRTGLAPFTKNSDLSNPVVDLRHIFAYPVTNHGVLEWSERDKMGNPKPTKSRKLRQTERFANQLRFKVHRVQGGYVVVAVHIPHRVPDVLLRKLRPQDQQFLRSEELKLWRKVHQYLDRDANLVRVQQATTGDSVR
ncbi:MAG: hypothetical protein KatS3mg007_1504 [Thermoanaerobaculum sp.]|nr:MAG: hypothetical protein KatS3mg007_1504 [Thermoanaerobaculum sp.]